MRLHAIGLMLFALLSPCLIGCGGDSGGVKLASATGVVTHNGAPLAGASVVATPENGPLAMGSTDKEGKFTLWTGDRNGVALGKIRVAVTVPKTGSDTEIIAPPTAGGTDPNASTQSAMQSMMKVDQASRKKGKKGAEPDKSPLAKYASEATSGLSYEIKPGTNNLPIELK